MINWRQASESLLVLGVFGLGAFVEIIVHAQYYSATNYSQEGAIVQKPLETSEDMTVGEMLAGHTSGADTPISGYPVAVAPVAYRGEVLAENGNYNRNANYISNASPSVGDVYPASVSSTAATRMPSMHVRQTAYEEVSEPAATHAVAQAQSSRTRKSTEPEALPEDFPSGEMASLNSNGLIAFSETTTTPEGAVQHVTIIDPAQKAMCVYHIHMASGQIELKSARKIEWDLQLIFLNSKRQLPQYVQAILEHNPRRH